MNWQSLELLTPCFCMGAHQTQPEIRVASIRGQLHFWARLCFHDSHPAQVEGNLFGSIKGRKIERKEDPVASAFRLVVRPPDSSVRAMDASPRSPSPYWTCAHDPGKGQRNHFPVGTKFDLGWELRTELDAVHGNEASLQQQMNRALKAWILLGGLGGRSNRAAGSVWPVDYAPSIDDFGRTITDYLPQDGSVMCKVLRGFVPEDFAHRFVHAANASEQLRAVACDTVNHDGLGFALGPNRKASPLKLKVGRFTEGLRLIAVWDNRHGRGADTPAAVSALIHNRPPKPLGAALQNVGIG